MVLSIDEKHALLEAKQRGERIATDPGLWDLIKPKWPIFEMVQDQPGIR
jgi:hypothetical protein